MFDSVTEARNTPVPGPIPQGPPDLLLIERARLADHRAIEALTRRYAQRLFRIARSMLGDEHSAEETVAESCVAAFEELRHHEPAGKFAPWLARLTLEHARARRDAAHAAALAAMPAPQPLERAIDALPEVFRTVFVLRVLEGISGPETALTLGLNVTTVRTRLFRAHRRLAADAIFCSGPQSAFELDTARGERIVAAVLSRSRDRSA
ncbi:MAG TPA: sigma factor-like helix-turn-helix DNA-binding protein [Steroidobacteraceae bacterium]|nr:sigma factor-like helix-turn-helix DNA-binding protein [Steroidobacteraceae bacterium]